MQSAVETHPRRPNSSLLKRLLLRLLLPLFLCTQSTSCATRHTRPQAPAPTPPHFAAGDLLTLIGTGGGAMIAVVHPSALTHEVLFPSFQSPYPNERRGCPRMLSDGSLLLPTQITLPGPTLCGPPSIVRLTRTQPDNVHADTLMTIDACAYSGGSVLVLNDSLFLWAFPYTPDGGQYLSALLLGNVTSRTYSVLDISDSLYFDPTGLSADGYLYVFVRKTGTNNRLGAITRYDPMSGTCSSVTRIDGLDLAGPIGVHQDGTIYCGAWLGNSAPYSGALIAIDPNTGIQTVAVDDTSLGVMAGLAFSGDSLAYVATGAISGYVRGRSGIGLVNLISGSVSRILDLSDVAGLELAYRDGPASSTSAARMLGTRIATRINASTAGRPARSLASHGHWSGGAHELR